jgi:hypothetical protein
MLTIDDDEDVNDQYNFNSNNKIDTKEVGDGSIKKDWPRGLTSFHFCCRRMDIIRSDHKFIVHRISDIGLVLCYNRLVTPLTLALSIKQCKSEWRGLVAIFISLFGDETANLGTINIGNFEISPGLESYPIRLDQVSGQQSMQNDKSTIMFYPINNDAFKATPPLVHHNPTDIQRSNFESIT